MIDEVATGMIDEVATGMIDEVAMGIGTRVKEERDETGMMIDAEMIGGEEVVIVMVVTAAVVTEIRVTAAVAGQDLVVAVGMMTAKEEREARKVESLICLQI